MFRNFNSYLVTFNLTKMDRKQRFNEAYNYLRNNGRLHTQKDVATKMGTTAPNVSSALKGMESVLTDNFLRRFNRAYDSTFSESWLLRGEGDMLNPSITQTVSGDGNTSVAGNGNHVNSDLGKALDEIAAQRRVTEKAQEQIDRLLSIIEKMNK